MSSFTPSFPPLILDKCLDLARYIANEKAGKAALEVNLGNSRFNFSIDFSSNIRTGRSSPGSNSKKKSPSDQRRDARRKQQFLEKKRTSSPPSPVTPLDPSSLNPSVAPSSLTVNPVIEEFLPNIEASEDMETMEEIVEKQDSIPVISPTRNVSNGDCGSVSASRIPLKNEQIKDLPRAISPINSPMKNDNLEEIHLLICAPNIKEATKHSKDYLQSTFVGPHQKNKHHF